jgi:hypothetical protein
MRFIKQINQSGARIVVEPDNSLITVTVISITPSISSVLSPGESVIKDYLFQVKAPQFASTESMRDLGKLIRILSDGFMNKGDVFWRRFEADCLINDLDGLKDIIEIKNLLKISG